MPGMSADGKESPTSMMRMRPASSTQAMFRPTSPTPPRNTTLTAASEETGILQSLAHALALLGRGRHQRKTRNAPRPAQHLKGRLHRDGVGGDEKGVEQRRQILVDLAGRRHVARADQLDHLADLRGDQGGGHGDES